jgi:hypothetical protein
MAADRVKIRTFYEHANELVTFLYAATAADDRDQHPVFGLLNAWNLWLEKGMFEATNLRPPQLLLLDVDAAQLRELSLIPDVL